MIATRQRAGNVRFEAAGADQQPPDDTISTHLGLTAPL
jgi:hypothetical protein